MTTQCAESEAAAIPGLDNRKTCIYLATEITALVSMASDLRQHASECADMASRTDLGHLQERLTALSAELFEANRTVSAIASDAAETLKEC